MSDNISSLKTYLVFTAIIGTITMFLIGLFAHQEKMKLMEKERKQEFQKLFQRHTVIIRPDDLMYIFHRDLSRKYGVDFKQLIITQEGDYLLKTNNKNYKFRTATELVQHINSKSQ